MIKLLKLCLIFFVISNVYAQNSATRFFYELTYKPKKESLKTEKTIEILDVAEKISIYKDYNLVAQDSILMQAAEKMHKSGVFYDIGKTIKWPAFTFKIKKEYPEMKTIFIDGISQKYFGYIDTSPQNWKIENETDKITGFPVQKATLDFGGRKWIAWFTNEISFQDGPYKFHGLPGLIVKIEDIDKNYSWVLTGIKKISDFSELSFTEKISGFKDVNIISKDKFEKAYNAFREDPFAEARSRVTPEMRSKKMPGSDITVGDLLKQQEERVNKFFKSNNNPIENNLTNK
ncbi:GLPGLI family protein [Chryseobacterium rhizosphaerae]|uniref:GLPGLI family protein n=1 Tax=Chryseobacterium rhizosphaerae TaxID=395937 RepID=UPI00235877F4|nr:GLPGLI family protein [Chryseobacterium rhizosphaerae]MDC8101447.1 GLPGLI family protein [Chryseobacterium rhizosphaerae]